jgi:hypothetical protein
MALTRQIQRKCRRYLFVPVRRVNTQLSTWAQNLLDKKTNRPVALQSALTTLRPLSTVHRFNWIIINRSAILPVALCGFETWSLTLRNFKLSYNCMWSWVISVSIGD